MITGTINRVSYNVADGQREIIEGIEEMVHFAYVQSLQRNVSIKSILFVTDQLSKECKYLQNYFLNSDLKFWSPKYKKYIKLSQATRNKLISYNQKEYNTSVKVCIEMRQ